MEQKNDVLSLLVDARNGAVVTDINEKLNELIDAVLDTGAKGELIIKLRVTPSKKGMGGGVLECEFDHDLKVKKPEFKIGKSTFYVSDKGRLSRNPPGQEAMFEEVAEEPQKKERNQ